MTIFKINTHSWFVSQCALTLNIKCFNYILYLSSIMKSYDFIIESWSTFSVLFSIYLQNKHIASTLLCSYTWQQIGNQTPTVTCCTQVCVQGLLWSILDQIHHHVFWTHASMEGVKSTWSLRLCLAELFGLCFVFFLIAFVKRGVKMYLELLWFSA